MNTANETRPLTVAELEALVELAQSHLQKQIAYLTDSRLDYDKNVNLADDDHLEEIEADIQNYTAMTARAEARCSALEADLKSAKARAKADTGKAHRDAAQAGADDVRVLLAEFEAECKKLSAITEKIYGITPKMRENVILARQYGVAVMPFHLVAPNLEAAHYALKAVGNISQNTYVAG